MWAKLRVVQVVLTVDLHARKLYLALGGELVAPLVIGGRVEIVSKDRRLINGIVIKQLVVIHVSVTLKENVDRELDSHFRLLPR